MLNLKSLSSFRENIITIDGCVPMKAIANMLTEKIQTKGAIAYGPISDGEFLRMSCNMKVLTQEEYEIIVKELKMLEQYFGETNYWTIHNRMKQK